MREIFLGCLFIFVSCNSDSSVPSGILRPKDMEAIVWDLIAADQTAEFYLQKDSSLQPLKTHAEYYQQVFGIHKTSKENFQRSLLFYEQHPLLLKPVLDSLQQKGQRISRNLKPV